MRKNSFWLLLALLFAAFFPLGALAQTAAEFRDHTDIPKQWPQQPVRSAHGMVATDDPLASQAGVEILKRGGNAVDAAVATAFALAVVEPAAGNIGGGGFMLVRLANGKTTFFDYREMAPGRATRDMYIMPNGKLDPEASTIGYRSVAVPGTVAGLALALKTFGKLKLADVIQPAIRYAEQGIPVTDKLVREFDEAEASRLSGAAIFDDRRGFRRSELFGQGVEVGVRGCAGDVSYVEFHEVLPDCFAKKDGSRRTDLAQKT